MEVDEGSDQHLAPLDARLKNEFTEDEKYNNLVCSCVTALLVEVVALEQWL